MTPHKRCHHNSFFCHIYEFHNPVPNAAPVFVPADLPPRYAINFIPAVNAPVPAFNADASLLLLLFLLLLLLLLLLLFLLLLLLRLLLLSVLFLRLTILSFLLLTLLFLLPLLVLVQTNSYVL